MKNAVLWLEKVIHRNKDRNTLGVDVQFMISMLDDQVVDWGLLKKNEKREVLKHYNTAEEVLLELNPHWKTEKKLQAKVLKTDIFFEIYDDTVKTVKSILKENNEYVDPKSEQFDFLVRLRFFIDTGKYPEHYLVDLIE